jgi:hypothetical protein
VFKNSIRTPNKTQHFAVTDIKWLNPDIQNAELLITKAGGTTGYDSALNG